MKLEKAIEGFLVSCSAEGYSRHTISDYGSHLRRMSRYLGNPELDEISAQSLKEFFAWLRNEYQPVRKNGDTSLLKPVTLNKCWCAVRGFYNWAEVDLDIARPDNSLKAPKFDRPTITPFTEKEIKAILKASEYSALAETSNRTPFKMKTPNAVRDKALILVLLDTGIRASECARLRVRDVNLENGETFIIPHGTGQKTKSRHVYLGNAARKALWKYLAKRKDIANDDFLFLTNYDRPMNRGSIRLVFRRIGKRAEVSPCYPHLFRHTFAIQYLRNGGDVFTLQRMLGHSTLDMVKRYLSIAKTDIQTAHRKASPVDRWRL